MQPITITARNEEYHPIEFHAPVPMPGCACIDPIPQEKKQTELQQQAALSQLRATRIAERKEQAHGVLQKLDVACDQAMHTLDKGVQSVINTATNAFQSQNDDHAFGRLRQHFPDLLTEKLFGDYRCKLCTRNGVLPGFMQITNNHVLFIPEDGSPFAIPLCAILCIQPIVQAQCPPAIPPRFVSANNAKEAEGLQLFCTSGQLFIFKEFLSIRSLPAALVTEALNIIDHLWRASTTVPNPNWTFVDNDKFVQPDVTVYPPTKSLSADMNHPHPNALETHS